MFLREVPFVVSPKAWNACLDVTTLRPPAPANRGSQPVETALESITWQKSGIHVQLAARLKDSCFRTIYDVISARSSAFVRLKGENHNFTCMSWRHIFTSGAFLLRSQPIIKGLTCDFISVPEVTETFFASTFIRWERLLSFIREICSVFIWLCSNCLNRTWTRPKRIIMPTRWIPTIQLTKLEWIITPTSWTPITRNMPERKRLRLRLRRNSDKKLCGLFLQRSPFCVLAALTFW